MKTYQELKNKLVESKLPWWQKKIELDLWQIYEIVKEIYPNLCDPNIIRIDNGEIEWKHSTIFALDILKKKEIVAKVNPTKKDGRWVKL